MNEKKFEKFIWKSFETLRNFGWDLDQTDRKILIFSIAVLTRDHLRHLNEDRYSRKYLRDIFAPLLNARYGKELYYFLETFERSSKSNEIVELITKLARGIEFSFEQFDRFEFDEFVQNLQYKYDRKTSAFFNAPSWYKNMLAGVGNVEKGGKVLFIGSDAGDYLIHCFMEFGARELIYMDKARNGNLLASIRAEFLGIELKTIHNYEIESVHFSDFDQVVVADIDSLIFGHKTVDMFFRIDDLPARDGRVFLVELGGSLDREFRYFLDEKIHNHELELQISCPNGVFNSSTSVAPNIFVLGRKNWQKTFFYDLTFTRDNQPTLFKETVDVERVFTDIKYARKHDALYIVSHESLLNEKDKRKYFADFHIMKAKMRKLISEIPNAVKLEDVFRLERGRSRGKLRKEEKYDEGFSVKSIMISDLDENSSDVFVRSASGIIRDSKLKRDEAIRKPCVVVSLIRKLKPKILDPSNFDGEIFLNDNLVAIYPKEDISLEYIVYQLSAPVITRQMKLLARGSFMSRITLKDFKSFYISITRDKEEQERFILIHKMALIEKEESRVEQLRSELELKEKREEAEFEIVRHISHSLNPKLAEVSSVLDSLQIFLEEKRFLTEPLDEALEDEEPEKVGDAINSALNRVKIMHRLIRSTRDLVAEKVPESAFEIIEPMKLLKDIHASLQSISPKAKIETKKITNKKKLRVRVSREYIQELFENLVRNSNIHAFDSEDELNQIEINIDADNDSVIIDYFNNGKPLPSELNTESFLRYGVKGQDSPGDGLGGAFVKKVIEAHNGEFKVEPSNGGACFKIILPLELGDE